MPEAFGKALDGQDLQVVANEVYEKFRDSLSGLGLKVSSGLKSRRPRGQKASKTKTKWMQKRAVKHGKYLRYQKLFQLHRGRLVRLILDDTEALQCQIPSGIVHSTFKERWETSVCFNGLESFPVYREADNTMYQDLITEKEIGKNMEDMRKTSAPGPDGITLGHLIKTDPKFSQLTEIFNLWLVTRTIPDALWDCQTVLIPKSSNEARLGDINNWRPITIASVVFRLFSRIATARLVRACPIKPRQQGLLVHLVVLRT